MSDVLLQYSAEGYRVVSPEALYGRNSQLESGHADYDGGYRSVTAEEFFGTGSYVADVTVMEPADRSLTADMAFQSIVVVTLVAYLYMLLRSWHFIGSIWGGVFTNRSERIMASLGGELPLQRFKMLAALIGGVAVSLIVVRMADGFIPNSSPIFINGFESLSPLVAILLVVVFVAWFYALHKVVEWITFSDSAAQLSAIGYMDFVRAVVLLYPFVVVWLLADGESVEWSRLVLLIGFVLLIILYLKDTFLLFVGKKIPILYWILYLCTAILLPLSFLAHLLPERLG